MFYLMGPSERITFLFLTMIKLRIIDNIYENTKPEDINNAYLFLVTCYFFKTIDDTVISTGGHFRLDGLLFAGKTFTAVLFSLHKTRIYTMTSLFYAGYSKM